MIVALPRVKESRRVALATCNTRHMSQGDRRQVVNVWLEINYSEGGQQARPERLLNHLLTVDDVDEQTWSSTGAFAALARRPDQS